MATPPRKAPAPQQIVPRDPRTGRVKKGAQLSPATQFKPGNNANLLGESHKIRIARLLEEKLVAENIASIAAGDKRKKAQPAQQIDAFNSLCDQAFGRPANNSVNVSTEVSFIKRVIGISEDML
jgi:hypothetical protein